MLNATRPRGTNSAKILTVIETRALCGLGTDKDPTREVVQYWDLDGTLLAFRDPAISDAAPFSHNQKK